MLMKSNELQLTYPEYLQGFLTHLHPSRLKHLHAAQVLWGEGELECVFMCSLKGMCACLNVDENVEVWLGSLKQFPIIGGSGSYSICKAWVPTASYTHLDREGTGARPDRGFIRLPLVGFGGLCDMVLLLPETLSEASPEPVHPSSTRAPWPLNLQEHDWSEDTAIDR